MPQSEERAASSSATAASLGHFPTTHWSVVLAAGGTHGSSVNVALETLFGTYWKPLYFYVRRRGKPHHDAEDLIQAFFGRLLEKDVMRQASQDRGRFRSFLLKSIQNFLANENDRAMTLKRGGAQPHISLDDLDYDDLPLPEYSPPGNPPESLFDREWAQTIFANAFQRLENEFRIDGKEPQFKALAPFLSQSPGEGAYDLVASQLAIRSGLMPTLVSRMRKRFQDLVRAEIAATVATPTEVDEELKYLVELMTRSAAHGL